MIYYDTSFLLAAILGQHHEIDFDAFWNLATDRVTSHLTRIEAWVALKRLQKSNPQLRESNDIVDSISSYLNAMHIKYIDSSIEDIIRDTEQLADCRTLDAVHLATALYFGAHSSELLAICTLDHRMRLTAAKIGFSVIPDIAA